MLTTLTALDICDNGLWEGGGRAIGQALALKRVLTILDLRNNIGTNGARKIGQAIQVNRAPWQISFATLCGAISQFINQVLLCPDSSRPCTHHGGACSHRSQGIIVHH